MASKRAGKVAPGRFTIRIKTGFWDPEATKAEAAEHASRFTRLLDSMLTKSYPTATVCISVDLRTDASLEVDVYSETGPLDFDDRPIIDAVRYDANVAWAESRQGVAT